jgi:hypothetical protein
MPGPETDIAERLGRSRFLRRGNKGVGGWLIAENLPRGAWILRSTTVALRQDPNTRRRPMVQQVRAHDAYFNHQPRTVSDRRLATLDLTAVVVSTIMALGPLTAYAVVG